MNQSSIKGSLGHKNIKGFQNRSEGPLWTLTNRRLKKIMIMKPILMAQSLPFTSGVFFRTPESEIGLIGRSTEGICLPQDSKGRI
jgi:hypothetical protein